MEKAQDTLVHGEESRRGVGHSTKVCPRCGQTLFADMDVCYGCLYDFTRKEAPHTLPSVSGSTWEPGRGGGAGRVGVTHGVAGQPQVVLTDDLDEPATPGTRALPKLVPGEQGPATAPVICVLVRTGDMDVTLDVPATGLRVGRAPSNDVVLHSKAVSREHVVLMPAEGGLIVRDLGSTNPPLVRGHPVEGSAHVPFGQSFSLCGSHFEPCER